MIYVFLKFGLFSVESVELMQYYIDTLDTVLVLTRYDKVVLLGELVRWKTINFTHAQLENRLRQINSMVVYIQDLMRCLRYGYD